MKNKRFIAVMAAATSVYLVPVVAKLVNPEMLWDETDFIAAAVLLFGSGLVFEFVARKAEKASNTLAYVIGAGLAVFTGLFLMWSNLAVGIIGSEDNPANLMYYGVLAIGIIGALVARFMPRGMALTMFSLSGAQALSMLIAMIGGLGQPYSGPVELLMLNAVFVLLWAGAGMLFLASSRPSHGILGPSGTSTRSI